MEDRVLADLDPVQRAAVLERCVRRRYARGQPLFHHGDPSDGMHLIRSGRVVIRISTPDGEEASLTVTGPGGAVGELSLLERSGRRTASAIAVEPVETSFLSRAAFEGLRSTDRELDRALLSVLAARVIRLTDQLIEALFVPASTRVLRRVADVAGMYGDGIIPLTQEEVASMAGSTRPTANRVLRAAASAGVVDLGRGRIRVLDLAGLRELAG
jgi:CRP/FNR family cyclic AMP-dependent transcriptional regulator